MKRIIVVGIFISGIIGSIVIFETIQRDTSSDVALSPLNEGSPQSTFFRKTRFFLPHPDQAGYEVIVENNLFRPLGWKKEVQLPGNPTATVIPEPKANTPRAIQPTYTLILTGIAKNGSDWIAVVEDQKNDAGSFLLRGNMVKDAQVRDIMPEHIMLVRGGMAVQLGLGDSIEYEADGRLLFDTVQAAKLTEHAD